MKYEPVVGLEIHVQLKTKSKMFCYCSADVWNEPPNSHVCPTCLGLPGALPYPNEKAIKYALLIGLALNCKVQKLSKFDRKNYFYPDLPKGYQISQYDLPFSQNGWVKIDSKKVGITRAHLEEDTAKMIHTKDETLLDFNRSGIPLMEIVSEPDLRFPREAKIFAQKIQQVIRYLDVSDADMEKGSLRVDANISLRKMGEKKLGTKVEVKNMNSFRSVEKALEYEIQRQTPILEKGGKVEQETRGWVETKLKTVAQRTKEFASDYRYFPEPDLVPFVFEPHYVEGLKEKIPELPHQKVEKFQKKFGLSLYDAEILASDHVLANFYEQAVNALTISGNRRRELRKDAKKVANIFINELLRVITAQKTTFSDLKILPAQVAQLFYLEEEGAVSAQGAKFVLSQMVKTGEDPQKIVKDRGLLKISQREAIEKIVERVIKENKRAVDDYGRGKKESFDFLLGQIMRQTQGQVDPRRSREILQEKLGK